MAAQIAEPTTSGINFEDEVLSPVSQLEAARQEAAEEQQKRIDEAIARMANKNQGKRKVPELRADSQGRRAKKSKTMVDAATKKADKSSIARRLADRFSGDEPEQEEQVATTRSVSTQQFVARRTTVTTGKTSAAVAQATEKEPAAIKVKEVTTEVRMEKSSSPAQMEDEEYEDKAPIESSEWNGPSTNFHLRQLGMTEEKVDIYKPAAEQQQDVRRIRERAMYLPEQKANATMEIDSEEENDSDFQPSDHDEAESEIESSDSESLSDVDAEEARALREDQKEFLEEAAAKAYAERKAAEAASSVSTSAVARLPLYVLVFVVLVVALLLAVDWSQETYQFCPVDSASADGSEELLSCATFVETQTQLKSSLREALAKAQALVQSLTE